MPPALASIATSSAGAVEPGLRAVLARGRLGEVYNIGGGEEMKNIDLVRTLCARVVLLDAGKVAANGPAAVVGLKEGDVVVAAAGRANL